jgi:hypothetical protein
VIRLFASHANVGAMSVTYPQVGQHSGGWSRGIQPKVCAGCKPEITRSIPYRSPTLMLETQDLIHPEE